MNHFQRDEQAITRQNVFQGFIDQNKRYREDIPPARPIINRIEPEAFPPFSALVEQECEDCKGTGQDAGALDNDYDPCSHCNGSGKETVLRKYLAEAFAIAAGQSSRPAEKEHLVAITQYARETVSALFAQPETKEAA
jgi:hypothetical protein